VKILLDENIPKTTLAALVGAGHDVLDIRGGKREGMSDAQLWQLAQTEGRLLVTTDKWFVQHRAEDHCGVLIVLLNHPNRSKINDRVLGALQKFEESDWPNLIVVMRDNVQSVWRSRPEDSRRSR
jgi:predicted nuclease of predicted toxin-antitoxin system